MFNRSLTFLTNTKKFLRNTVKLGYDTCHRTHGYDANPCYNDCKQHGKTDFARKCKKDGGLFKCCIRFSFKYTPYEYQIRLFRRDKEFCHECRYCCTLSICTTKYGSSFKFSNESVTEGKEEGSYSGTINAAMGFLTDMRMYKTFDFRCLKPNPKVPSKNWGHYEMHGYRAAASKEELGRKIKLIM